jgi:hypothetical protein
MTGGVGETNSTYRRRTMWRMSKSGTLIFIAAVVVMVAVALLLMA